MQKSLLHRLKDTSLSSDQTSGFQHGVIVKRFVASYPFGSSLLFETINTPVVTNDGRI